MDNILKSLILKCFRDINKKNLQNSSDALDTNVSVLNNTINDVNNASRSLMRPLPILIQDGMEREARGSNARVSIIETRISRLDSSDPSTEVEELRLDNSVLQERVRHSTFIAGLLGFYLGDLGIYFDRRVSAMNFLNDRNRDLSSELQKNVQIESDLNDAINRCQAQGSLVDDFANPNTEMPSYMDPED